MIKRTHFLILACFLFLLGASIFELSAQKLKFENNKVDLGNIKKWDNPAATFYFKNPGKKTLYFLRTYTERDLKIVYEPKEVRPGERGMIRVYYYPSKKGPFKKKIEVFSNASGYGDFLIVSGNIKNFSSNAQMSCPDFRTPPSKEEILTFEQQVTIVDKETYKPINNAKVTIKGDGPTVRGKTAKNGVYQPDVYIGRYTVEAHASGYYDNMRTAYFNRNSENLIIELSPIPNSEQEDEPTYNSDYLTKKSDPDPTFQRLEKLDREVDELNDRSNRQNDPPTTYERTKLGTVGQEPEDKRVYSETSSRTPQKGDDEPYTNMEPLEEEPEVKVPPPPSKPYTYKDEQIPESESLKDLDELTKKLEEMQRSIEEFDKKQLEAEKKDSSAPIEEFLLVRSVNEDVDEAQDDEARKNAQPLAVQHTSEEKEYEPDNKPPVNERLEKVPIGNLNKPEKEPIPDSIKVETVTVIPEVEDTINEIPEIVKPVDNDEEILVPEEPLVEPEIVEDVVTKIPPTESIPVVEASPPEILDGKLNDELFHPNNILFLLDVSSSMRPEDKLPLLKNSIKQLAKVLRSTDQVSIMTYAQNSQLVLPPTTVANLDSIYKCLDTLVAYGSTNSVKGLSDARQLLLDNYYFTGNNQLILATDGQFRTDKQKIKEYYSAIEAVQERHIILSVIAYGEDPDAIKLMQKTAKLGGGSFLRITSESDAPVVLIEEIKSRSRKFKLD